MKKIQPFLADVLQKKSFMGLLYVSLSFILFSIYAGIISIYGEIGYSLLFVMLMIEIGGLVIVGLIMMIIHYLTKDLCILNKNSENFLAFFNENEWKTFQENATYIYKVENSKNILYKPFVYSFSIKTLDKVWKDIEIEIIDLESYLKNRPTFCVDDEHSLSIKTKKIQQKVENVLGLDLKEEVNTLFPPQTFKTTIYS